MFRSVLGNAARLLLVCALFAAWQSSLLHPMQHVGQNGKLVHIVGANATDDPQPGSDLSSKLCDALGALTACASDVPRTSAPVFPDYVRFSHVSGVRATSSAPPFFAQAPPRFS